MIAPDAVPISHTPPYKRIDLAHPQRRPNTITLAEAESAGLSPDLKFYEFIYGFGWVLKELP